MDVGDYVGRKSYRLDIVFRIKEINNGIALLEGVYVRLIADSPLEDLVPLGKDALNQALEREEEYKESVIKSYNQMVGHVTGKILHIDSDPLYLQKCLNLYQSLNLYAYGVTMKESDIEQHILDLILRVRPNIVVLTGHDSYNKKGLEDLANYRNTTNYMKAILKIREHFSLDDISIFAGACGSNFEALIASGANFASSYNRKNIEAYDPAIVAILCAITPRTEIVNINTLYTFSKMNKGSIGGVETFGKMRLLIKP